MHVVLTERLLVVVVVYSGSGGSGGNWRFIVAILKVNHGIFLVNFAYRISLPSLNQLPTCMAGQWSNLQLLNWISVSINK